MPSFLPSSALHIAPVWTMNQNGEIVPEAVLDGGFLAAEGLVDDDLTIEPIRTKDNPDDIRPPANFRDCLFRIWPIFTYSMQEVR